MTFDTAAISLPGPRAVNEDAVGFAVDPKRGFGAWFIADGLGGHAHGEIAARIAVDAALEFARSFSRRKERRGEQGFFPPPEARGDPAIAAVAAADRGIRAHIAAQQSHSGMRTTFVAAIAREGVLHVAYLGDSRLYLLRGGEIRYRTRDHSLAELDVRLGEIDEDGIPGHPDRNVVLRMLPMDGPAWLRGQPATLPLCAADALLLCTDGFWECLSDAQVRGDLSASADAADWLGRMTRRVTDRGARDNTSAICCRIWGGE